MLKLRAFVITVIVSLVSQSQISFAASLTDETIGSIINNARSSAQQVLASAELVADRQIAHAANETLIVAKELELAFAGQLDKTLNTFDSSTYAAFEEVDLLRQSFEDAPERVSGIFDDVSLDIEHLLGNTFFAKYPMWVKRVSGFNQLYQTNANYSFQLTGSGFGGGKVSMTSLRLNGDDIISDVNLNPSGHVLSVSIPKDILNQHFDITGEAISREIKAVPISVGLQRPLKKAWWQIFGKPKVESIQHDFYLYLIPPYAGVFKYKAFKEEFGWVEGGVLSFAHITRDNSCHGDCDNDDLGDWRISQHGADSSQQKCVAQPQQTPPREGDQKLETPRVTGDLSHHRNSNVSLQGNSTCLHYSIKSFGTSRSLTVSANLKTYVKNSEPTIIEEVEKLVEFGKTYQIQMPAGSLLATYEFDPLGSAPLNSGELKAGKKNYAVNVTSVSTAGDLKVFTIRIPYPGEYPVPSP